MRYFAIIVAGGKGTRMKSKVPKQFHLLAGKPVLMHTIKKFFEADKAMNIIIVLPQKEIATWRKLCRRYRFTILHKVVAGGKERFDSVKNALNIIKKEGIIAVHDGVRPLVSYKLIRKAMKKAAQKGSGVPYIESNESVRIKSGLSNKAADRKSVVRIQTPQCFRSLLLKKAYQQKYKSSFTDDASVMEAAGYPVFLVKGRKENIKITTPEDLLLAEAILAKA